MVITISHFGFNFTTGTDSGQQLSVSSKVLNESLKDLAHVAKMSYMVDFVVRIFFFGIFLTFQNIFSLKSF